MDLLTYLGLSQVNGLQICKFPKEPSETVRKSCKIDIIKAPRTLSGNVKSLFHAPVSLGTDLSQSSWYCDCLHVNTPH